MSPEKEFAQVRKMCTPSWSFPCQTYTEVRVFCGLSGHYFCFIRDFASLVPALYDLLGDEVEMGPVKLTPEAEEAVQVLKEKISSVPVLVFPNFDKSFFLETDASKEGLGVVLLQKMMDATIP